MKVAEKNKIFWILATRAILGGRISLFSFGLFMDLLTIRKIFVTSFNSPQMAHFGSTEMWSYPSSQP